MCDGVGPGPVVRGPTVTPAWDMSVKPERATQTASGYVLDVNVTVQVVGPAAERYHDYCVLGTRAGLACCAGRADNFLEILFQ